MFHSDQGVQYSAKVFRTKLTQLNITQSMSRRGNYWDHLSFITHHSVVSETENYIQFYNYKRRHSSIDYMTPHQKYNELKKVA